EAERTAHWGFKPGFWDVLFSLGRRLKEWQKRDDDLLHEVEHLRAVEVERKAAIARAKDEVARCEREFLLARREFEEAQRRSATSEKLVDRARIGRASCRERV